MSVEVRRTDEGLELELTGEWVAQRLALIQTGLAAVDVAAARQVSIATQQLTALDLSGAWALRQFVRRARAAGAAVTFRARHRISCACSTRSSRRAARRACRKLTRFLRPSGRSRRSAVTRCVPART